MGATAARWRACCLSAAAAAAAACAFEGATCVITSSAAVSTPALSERPTESPMRDGSQKPVAALHIFGNRVQSVICILACSPRLQLGAWRALPPCFLYERKALIAGVPTKTDFGHVFQRVFCFDTHRCAHALCAHVARSRDWAAFRLEPRGHSALSIAHIKL
eukprot:5934805-Pleurochrysis_carterae.AAC.2